MQLPLSSSGLELANWHWKAVRQFIWGSFGLKLSPSNCRNYLHRLEFNYKRPKRRLVEADEWKWKAFVAEYGVLMEEARRTGVDVFFVDEACFRADAASWGKWALRGEPVLVDSTDPKYGEKVSYYLVVCLETGEVEWMELEGNSNSGTWVAFLDYLSGRHCRRLNAIWDSAPTVAALCCGNA